VRGPLFYVQKRLFPLYIGIRRRIGLKMTRIAAVLLPIVLLVSVLACESGNRSGTVSMRAPMVTATAVPTVAPSSCNWSGSWDTEWGIMVLVQTGVNVSGTYGRNDGRITGTASGNIVTGTWSEWPSYAPPDHACDIELELAGDCTTLTGHWRRSSTDHGWFGSWSGKWLSSLSPTSMAIR